MSVKSIICIFLTIIIMSGCGENSHQQTAPRTSIKSPETVSPPNEELLENEYPMPNLIPAYGSRIIRENSNCKSNVPIKAPQFKEAIYESNISVGKVTLTQSGFNDEQGAIAYQAISDFEKLPVGFDRGWLRQGGILPRNAYSKEQNLGTTLDPEAEENNANKGIKVVYRINSSFVSPVDTNALLDQPPKSRFKFEGKQEIFNSTADSHINRDLVVNVRFDGCSQSDAIGIPHDTQIWTVQELAIEKDPYGGPDLIDEVINYYEYATKLGWFTSTARSENEIYVLQSLN